MEVVISPEIEAKIGGADHGHISREEVNACFSSHGGLLCYDKRPEHLDKEGRPSPWFVSMSSQARCLKIMFVVEHGKVFLKSAYPATEDVKRIYRKYAE